MGFDVGIFGSESPEPAFLEWLVDERFYEIQRHFIKLWDYYANRMYESVGIGSSGGGLSESARCYLQAQEYGLPPRITGFAQGNGGVYGGKSVGDIQRKEVVIENDISWRINAAVDFLFGQGVSFLSKSPDRAKRSEIEEILKGVVSANGGVGFFQNMAVLGGVYGFVDCLVRPGSELNERAALLKSGSPPRNGSFQDALEMAETIVLELIEAPRALPILDESDYRKIRFYVQHFYQKRNSVSGKNTFLSRLFGQSRRGGERRQTVSVTEIISPEAWQRYENKELVGEGDFSFGFLPVVHIQNTLQPYQYEGASDVEVLVPLQDELNTRLSDRASRITFQSFKMYLGKGVEGFEDRPVSPGRMWCTDNPEASIEEFGGDSSMPSEESHISEIKEAMDKASGVTPLVAGVLKGKLGNLTSAVALRLTLMGMLSKTSRKQHTYGDGLKQLCRMVLAILDKAGVYSTAREDREVEVVFPSPLPENMTEKLREAKMKKEVGVSTEQVLRELGYETEK